MADRPDKEILDDPEPSSLGEMFNAGRTEPSPKLLQRIATQIKPPRRRPRQRIEDALDLLVSAYVSVFTSHYAPRGDSEHERLLPYIQSGVPDGKTYEMVLWPYPQEEDPLEKEDSELDVDLEAGLDKFFTDLYVVAPKGLRVFAPLHPKCQNGEFILRSVDAFVMLKGLRNLIEAQEFATLDDHPDYMPHADAVATEVIKGENGLIDGKPVPAFATEAELQKGRAASFHAAAHDLLKPDEIPYADDKEGARDFIQHLPMRPYLTRSQALHSSHLVQQGSVLPFTCDQLELDLYKILGVKPPAVLLAKKGPECN